jgi:hypothetical protein
MLFVFVKLLPGPLTMRSNNLPAGQKLCNPNRKKDIHFLYPLYLQGAECKTPYHYMGLEMPDFIFCKMIITGADSEISKFIEASKGYRHSFNYVIEKDWGSFSDIAIDIAIEMLQVEGRGSKVDFCFNSLIPVPEILQVLPYDAFCFEELLKKNDVVKLICEKHSVNQSCQIWELENWGVKWGDLSSTVVTEPGCVKINFDTAWDPPHKFWINVSKKFPELRFIMFYSHEDGRFTGEAIYKDGEFIYSQS